jgi:RNA-binding motif X-linked protein 2
VHVNLVRDKETGKSKGFAFLKYEDQRSTDLAVDNLGGATVMGRLLRVDHARYKRKDEEEEEDNVAKLMGDSAVSKGKKVERKKGSEIEERRPLLKEEKELENLIRNHDEEDPMKEFLIEEKKEEVARAIELWDSTKKSSRRRDDSRERSSRHHRRHRSRSPRERRHRDERSPGRERHSRYKSPERGDKPRRDRSPKKSRSPESRRHRSDRDRHDRRR